MLYKHSKIHSNIDNKVLSRSKKRFKHDSATIYIGDSIKDKIDTSYDSKMNVNTYSDPTYDREETSAYIGFNSCLERSFDGPSYLVGKATSKTSCMHENIKEEDIMLHLITARFVTTLSKNKDMILH